MSYSLHLISIAGSLSLYFARVQVQQGAAVVVQALDGWMVTQQVVTAQHGRLVVKRLVDHDELQQRAADFIDRSLIRPGTPGLLLLQKLDANSSNQGMVPQLQRALQQWQEEQQQPSSDEEEYNGSDDEGNVF